MAKPGDEIAPTEYRKKPVVIQAIRWSGTNLREVIDFTGRHPSGAHWTWEEYEAVVAEKGLKIFSLEGSNFIVTKGDYIIKGVKGEFYACKPDIFWMTYDRASTPVSSTAPLSSAAWAILRMAASNERVVSQCYLEEQVAPYVKLERLGLLRDTTPAGEKVRDEWQITQHGLDVLELLGAPLSAIGTKS